MSWLLTPTGSWAMQNGSWLVNNAATQAAIEECCCVSAGCDCEDICDSPSWRVIFQAEGCDPDTSNLECYTSATYTGSMTEQDPATSPAPLPAGSSVITRYWTSTTNMLCADPSTPLIEFACTNVDQKRYIRIDEAGGGVWRDVSSGDCSIPYWNVVNLSEFQVEVTEPSCCGVPYLEIWCGATPAVPNCDLVGSGDES